MTAQTAFRSDERFTQDAFRRWLDDRPQSDIIRNELLTLKSRRLPQLNVAVEDIFAS